MRLDELTLCTAKINDRNLCPDPSKARRTQESARSFVILGYNPSVHEVDEVQVTIPYSTFTVMGFSEKDWDFKEVINEVDTFCYENPNHMLECDVHIFRSIPPLQ